MPLQRIVNCAISELKCAILLKEQILKCATRKKGRVRIRSVVNLLPKHHDYIAEAAQQAGVSVSKALEIIVVRYGIPYFDIARKEKQDNVIGATDVECNSKPQVIPQSRLSKQEVRDSSKRGNKITPGAGVTLSKRAPKGKGRKGQVERGTSLRVQDMDDME